MEAELKSLNAQRGAIKTKLTLLRRLIESPSEIRDVAAFEKRVRSNDSLIEKFDVLQLQIETLVFGTPNAELQMAEREAFERSYFELMSAAEQRLIILRGAPSPVANSSGSVTDTGSDLYSSTRLPVIKLPVFDGDFSQWIRFRDTFISLVHNSGKLSKIDKFNYLVSALTGSAALVLESFSISAENYELAWSRLKERFNDPRTLLTHLIDSLLAIEPLRKSDAKALSEFGDKAVNNVRALESLLKLEELWDALVCIHLSKRLDSASLDEWEKRVMQSDTRPTFPELSRFVEQRVIYLNRKDGNKPPVTTATNERGKPYKPREASTKQYVPSSYTASRSSKCLICNGDHALYHCTKLSAMSFPERHEAIKRARVCFNCLSPGHSISSCTRGTCRKCGQKHHTLLHREDPIVERVPAPKPLVATTQVASTSQVSDSYFAHSANVPAEYTVLSTAVVFVVDQKGQKHKCRALLDVGSQAHFISKEFCNKLSLPTTNTETMIGGIGNSRNSVDSRTLLHISSVCGNFSREIDCLVIDRITDEMPNIPLNKVNILIPRGVRPADPDFQRPGRIDLLIGAGMFWDLLCIGQFKVGVGSLMWQKTRLGWVLGGSVSFPKSHFCTTVRTCHAVTDTQLERGLARFWEIEDLGSRDLTKIDSLDSCEQHFNATTTRDSTGRYIVSIPFNDKLKQLGTSREQAERRLISMERKFRRNPDLKQQYVKFMHEYESLGHMTRLTPIVPVDLDNCFYLPHHAVFKHSSTTTKLRVVFDGSAKTSSGISLNDTQLVGPPLQGDLFNILVRFRKHRIVLSADIEKMYRQVLVKPEHRRYQRILWRSDDSENIAEFSLNTVTYGTASASYLATRTLREVGGACEQSHPDVSAVINDDFYVDDLLTGCETLQQAVQLRHILTRILDQAGFPLRKWASNDPKAMTHDNDTPSNIEFKAADKDAKTLGLL
ncbi:uncharacterized protein LOC143218338 [Lasioglossum baleicum]|uniref:uncharacterized protein LOC143218338 n=1 Tax=Lasioglossum baleicum TaxID=434251 RepID=UPI003FCC3B6D